MIDAAKRFFRCTEGESELLHPRGKHVGAGWCGGVGGLAVETDSPVGKPTGVLWVWAVPFGLIGDGVNIVYINRKLKALKSGAKPAAAADG